MEDFDSIRLEGPGSGGEFRFVFPDGTSSKATLTEAILWDTRKILLELKKKKGRCFLCWWR